MRRACRCWQLLPPGERIVLAVSGGWDSLAMVDLVAEHARSVQPRCDLLGLHVTQNGGGRTDPLPLETVAFCNEHGVPVESVTARLDPGEGEPRDCYACARVRRRTLLEEADARGFRYVALGHHADDVVETWLLSLFFTGTPETLAPIRSYFDDAVTLVRPLYELRKGEIRSLARRCAYPPATEVCTLETDSRREQIRRMLAGLGRDQRRVRRQLYWAAVRQLETGIDAGARREPE
jgi:tRNA 2-thiocytidine biosynthesis protein TtcA